MRAQISIDRLSGFRSAGLLLFALISLPLCGFGQGLEASITGVVTDRTEAVLPGVLVTATHMATNAKLTANTDDAGMYTILNLRSGTYQLRAEMPGFKTYLQRDIVVRLQQIERLDIRMELGEITQEVIVSGAPPMLNSETSEKGQVITQEEVANLPLETREFYDLALLTVGVVPKEEGGQGSFANINGARGDSINFVVDGGNNNILRGGDATVRPSLDAVGEFTVRTSTYTAEYGRRSSGVINMVLRSGTNDFHGTLFGFHRSNKLDSKNHFDRRKSQLSRSSLGGNLGGPIIRDRMFFFGNYEAMRLRAGQPRLGRVPSVKERLGDFSEGATKIIDPLTGQQFKNKRIPETRIDPVAARVLEFIPVPDPTGLGGTLNYYSNKIDRDRFDDLVGKVDYNFYAGHTLSVRYLLNDRVLSNPYAGSILPGFGNTGSNKFQMAGINYTHMFRPTLLTQVAFTFARKNSNQYALNRGIDYGKQLGLSGLTEDPKLFGFPRFTIRNYTDIGDASNMPLDWTENDYQIANATTWIRGKHSIRLGGEAIRTQFFQLFANNARGTFNFLGRWTNQPLADFFLGMLNNTTRSIRQTTSYLFVTTYAGFVQDDWKISRRLTLNLGFRYDLFLPPYDKFDRWSNFVPELGRVVTAGEEGFPKSLVHSDRNNFAPRFGFAWRFGRHSVLRGGFGMFFGTSLLNPLRQSLGANPPFAVRETYSRVSSDPLYLTLADPFPGNKGNIAGVNAPDGYELHAKTAHLEQYNLSLDHELTASMVLETAYVGSKGTHLGRRYDINQPLRSVEFAPGGPFPRPYPEFATIDYYAMEANSNYHALQIGLRKRGRGLNLRFNYSLSKSIDDASRLSGRSVGGFEGVQDSLNRAAERGLSDFDRRHAFTGSVMYWLHMDRYGGWLGFLLRNWQFNSIVRLYTGTPITPQLANYDFNAGEAKRPDRIGSGKLANPTQNLWFKVDDFVPVPPGSYRFGDSGRGIIAGPPGRYVSVSVMRYFYVREHHRIQFRWEIFNPLNLVNFRMPSPFIDTPAAGVISSAAPARQMQFALRYIF